MNKSLLYSDFKKVLDKLRFVKKYQINPEYINLPKNIYVFWYDGFDNLPPIAEMCIKLWEKLNPEFNVLKLDKNDLNKCLQELGLLNLNIPVQPLSDILRVYILSRYGGVWTDATVLPIMPLNNWLPENFQQSFFAFRCHHAPYCLISSWFLVSSAKHKITEEWLKEILCYWDKSRTLYMDPREGNPTPENPLYEVYNNKESETYPYFFLHYLFTGMILKNDHLRNIWDKVPTISSTPLHKLQNYMRTHSILNENEVINMLDQSIVEKLDWRLHIENLDLLYSLILKRNGGK